MNSLIVMGHLGKDPEVRYIPNGHKVTSFSVCDNRGKEKNIWWKITVWGDRFDKIIGYLKKGSAVVVSGYAEESTHFVDRQGETRITHNMTALEISFSPFGKKEERPVMKKEESIYEQQDLPF